MFKKKVASITTGLSLIVFTSGAFANAEEGYKFIIDETLEEYFVHCGDNTFDHIVKSRDTGEVNISSGGGYKDEIEDRLEKGAYQITSHQKLNRRELNLLVNKYDACN